MKKLIAALAVFAILANVPPAQAFPFSGPQGDDDDSAYYVDIEPFVNGATVAKAGTLGRGICARLSEGHSEGQLIAMMSQLPNGTVSDAKYIVHAAEWHYCPDYY